MTKAKTLESAAQQVERLGDWIIANVEGEPSLNQGAVDTAIRLLEKSEGTADAFEDVMNALSAALEGDDSYAERPAELVWKLRDERDALSELLSEAEREWIEVTPETMPNPGTFVLGACSSGVRVVHWRGNGWTTVPGGWSVKPTHWQPLPAPPVLPR